MDFRFWKFYTVTVKEEMNCCIKPLRNCFVEIGHTIFHPTCGTTHSELEDCAKFNFKGYDFILGQLSSALTRYNLAIIGRVVYNTSFACKTVFSLTLTGMANNREHEQIKSF